MPLQFAFLDTGPLGTVTQRQGHAEGEACRRWLFNLEASGVTVMVPEIADYELRRELIRTGNTTGIERLNLFVDRQERLISLQTVALREAARMWAEARNAGQPTAPPHALDGDVILAGQVLQFCAIYALSVEEVIVATVNVRHIARFVPSAIWQNIRADNENEATE